MKMETVAAADAVPPVRLRFDAGQPELAKLRLGLSAKVTVALSKRG